MIKDKSNAEHYVWGEVCDGWHLVKTDGLSVIQERVPPGKSERKHFHTKARQFFYILRGIGTIEFDDKKVELKAGQGIEIAPDTPHKFINESTEDVEFLVISSPKSHGDRTDL